MEISKQRFYELGLGVDKESCLLCEDCKIKNGKAYCGDLDIEKVQEDFEFAPCLDEERIRHEMSDEEYDAYRHGKLNIKN